jgi:molybdopterin-guanine dinucleotide biosynthesis protein B
MKLFGIAGWSGSGKTTLVVRLLPELIGRGLTVSTVKHAHHGFDIDTPGKDSYQHRKAGAAEVLVSSRHRWALLHENGEGPEATLDELVSSMSLVEGFKAEEMDKLEVHRPAIGKALLYESDPRIVVVASDAPLPGAALPVLDLDDTAAVADFIVAHCGLTAARQGVA